MVQSCNLVTIPCQITPVGELNDPFQGPRTFTASCSKPLSEKAMRRQRRFNFSPYLHLLAGKDVLGNRSNGNGKNCGFCTPRSAGHDRRTTPTKAPHTRTCPCPPHVNWQHKLTSALAPTARTSTCAIVSFFGGVKQGPQVRALQKGLDVLIATPGRLLDLIGQGHIDIPR